MASFPDGDPTGVLGQVMPNMGGGLDPVDFAGDSTFDGNAARLAALTISAIAGSLGGLFKGYLQAKSVVEQDAARAEFEGVLEALENELGELRSKVGEQDVYIELLEAELRRKGMGKSPTNPEQRAALRARASERKARVEAMLGENRRRADERKARRATLSASAATAGFVDADDDCCGDHECVGEQHELCCGGSVVDAVFEKMATGGAYGAVDTFLNKQKTERLLSAASRVRGAILRQLGGGGTSKDQDAMAQINSIIAAIESGDTSDSLSRRLRNLGSQYPF